MKQYLIIAAFLTGAAFLFSCGNKAVYEEDDYGTTKATIKSFSITRMGVLRARKSYASIQFIEDEKEREAYLDKQEKSNPELYEWLNKSDSFLIGYFEKLGLIKENSFLLENFKSETADSFNLITGTSTSIKLKFYNDIKTGKIWFNAVCKNDTLKINTGGTTLQNLDYAFLDIIPGSNKELVFLDDYYIMNGDNYDFLVYEITTD